MLKLLPLAPADYNHCRHGCAEHKHTAADRQADYQPCVVRSSAGGRLRARIINAERGGKQNILTVVVPGYDLGVRSAVTVIENAAFAHVGVAGIGCDYDVYGAVEVDFRYGEGLSLLPAQRAHIAGAQSLAVS